MNAPTGAMERSDIAKLLAFCAAFDQRTIGDADVLDWHEALSSTWVPNLGLEEAQGAVIEHYRATSERIAPADILKRVKDTRGLAMSRGIPKAEGVPPSEDYLAARAELNARLGTAGGEIGAEELAREQVAESRRERHADLDAEIGGGVA